MTRTERNLHMGSPTKDAPTGTLTYSEESARFTIRVNY